MGLWCEISAGSGNINRDKLPRTQDPAETVTHGRNDRKHISKNLSFFFFKLKIDFGARSLWPWNMMTYLHVDFVFRVAKKYCVNVYFRCSWLCILLRCGFTYVLNFCLCFIFRRWLRMCILFVCKLEIWNWSLKRKGKPNKKTLQIFIIILMNKFNSSKEKKEIFRIKNKNESIYHQDRNFNTDKRNPNCLWLFGRQFRQEPIKTEFSPAPEVSVCFLASIRLLPGSRLEKITGKNLNAKLIKKETNLNLKHCL